MGLRLGPEHEAVVLMKFYPNGSKYPRRFTIAFSTARGTAWSIEFRHRPELPLFQFPRGDDSRYAKYAVARFYLLRIARYPDYRQ